MNVSRLTDNIKSCANCFCYSETAYTVTVHNISILLCDQCKHELTFELISN